MIFDSALTSDFVKWNKEAIEENGSNLACHQLWENEPLDCIMQVISVKYINDENVIVLDCTQDCGQHIFYELGREDYMEMSESLGADMLCFADSFAEVASRYLPEEEKGYDFDEDFVEIHKRIILGTLPVCRKREP